MKSVLAMVLAAAVSAAVISPSPVTPRVDVAPVGYADAGSVDRAVLINQRMISPNLTDLLAVFIGTDATDAIAGAIRSSLSTVLQTPVDAGGGPHV
jgi:hypothetical protein